MACQGVGAEGQSVGCFPEEPLQLTCPFTRLGICILAPQPGPLPLGCARVPPPTWPSVRQLLCLAMGDLSPGTAERSLQKVVPAAASPGARPPSTLPEAHVGIVQELAVPGGMRPGLGLGRALSKLLTPMVASSQLGEAAASPPLCRGSRIATRLQGSAAEQWQGPWGL